VRIWDSSKDSLENELKFRLFFKLCLKDDDFVNRDIDASVKGVFHAMNRKPPHLMVSCDQLNMIFTRFAFFCSDFLAMLIA
jgi:hypothetical protein